MLSKNNFQNMKEKDSCKLKDMETYKYLMDIMHSRKKAFLSYYMKKINAFFVFYIILKNINSSVKIILFRIEKKRL